jgi:hypothetical protein
MIHNHDNYHIAVRYCRHTSKVPKDGCGAQYHHDITQTEPNTEVISTNVDSQNMRRLAEMYEKHMQRLSSEAEHDIEL